MTKYFSWIFVFMASLIGVSAYADDNTNQKDDNDEVAVVDDAADEVDEMEDIDE